MCIVEESEDSVGVLASAVIAEDYGVHLGLLSGERCVLWSEKILVRLCAT